jgi:hypothetical protein
MQKGSIVKRTSVHIAITLGFLGCVTFGCKQRNRTSTSGAASASKASQTAEANSTPTKDGISPAPAPVSAEATSANLADFAWEMDSLPACIDARAGKSVYVWRVQKQLTCNNGAWN